MLAVAERELELTVRIWTRKGDVHDPGKYRSITLLSHMMKLLERILDGRIRAVMKGEIEKKTGV